MRTYHVYILASESRRLYTGVTGNLLQRIWRHRFGAGAGFTQRYRITKLVYYEQHADVLRAIAREKDIKRRDRSYRVRLIERTNAGWLDLAAFWFD